MSATPRSVKAIVVALLAVLSLGLAGAPDALARPRATSTTTATSDGCSTTTAAPMAARLRVRVTSTAASAALHIRPTQVTGRQDLSKTGGATTAFVADGVQVNVPAGSKGVVDTEIIAADPSRVSDLTVAVDKTAGGSVAVKIWASSGYGRAVNLSVSATTGSVVVPRSQLFDPSFSLPKADSRKLVLAAYYPWFTADGWSTLPVAERPLQPRSVWSPEGVLSMTRQARDNGVDGFVVSWMGADKNGEAYDLAASAAAQTNGVVAPYLEVSEALNHGGVATVEQWLREAVDRTGPASLTMGGLPVVFVWSMSAVSAADWAGMVSRLDRPVKLIGDADTATHGRTMNGWHAYLPPVDLTGHALRSAFRSAWFRGQAALDPSITPMANVATVSPGFDDTVLRGSLHPVVSRSGGRYDATWDAAVAADPDMILVTSWNEWFEGTEIEPGTLNGSTALATTAARSAEWKASGSTCTLTTSSTDSTTTSSGTTKRGRR